MQPSNRYCKLPLSHLEENRQCDPNSTILLPEDPLSIVYVHPGDTFQGLDHLTDFMTAWQNTVRKGAQKACAELLWFRNSASRGRSSASGSADTIADMIELAMDAGNRT